MTPEYAICVHCGGYVTMQSMTSAGASWSCPCRRTTLTSLNDGRLELVPPALVPIIDRDPGDETDR